MHDRPSRFRFKRSSGCATMGVSMQTPVDCLTAIRPKQMISGPQIVARAATFPLLFVYFLLTGCHSSSRDSTPTVAFSKVPAAYQESPYRADLFERDYKTYIIEGRATGARHGQRIVLYANTDGRWGVCRQSGQPFANIETAGRWKASVHLGTQYAALLVDPTYNPPEQN